MKPLFFSTATDFRVVLKNVNYSAYPMNVLEKVQVTEQVTRMEKLLSFCLTARTREEMQLFIGIQHREYFRTAFLKPLLSL